MNGLRPVFAGFYLPRAEPRPIPDGVLIHRPESWNDVHEVEEDSAPDKGAVEADEGDEMP